MSHYDYLKSREIAANNYPFYAIIMGAIRQADTDNLNKLESIFPEIVAEFKERYNAPGGWLCESEKPEHIENIKEK